ncbi:MAG: hypothetical protein IPH07_23675 [Deltaproteobacteria bacterium]|nr:hypothetical protein [Deltaproteobacteria bacterium]
MTTSTKPSLLAFFQESTQGTGPANGAAWVSSGVRIRHVGDSVDVSGIEQAVVEDERSQEGIFDVEYSVKGLRNTSFPMSLYMTGSGATTAQDDTIAETPLMTVLEHALGGMHLSNSTVLAGGGHTTTVINVDDATNIVEGCLIQVQDATDGTIAVRRVLDVSTLAVTLDEALPFTPADADVVPAMATFYVDETVLVDSSAGPTTLSWLIQKGLAAALENFELNGCKSELKSIALTRGGLPTLSFDTMVASFDPPGTAPSPTWSSDPIGNAPVSIGPDTVITYQTQGTTTINPIHVSEFSVEVGVPVVSVDTNTEVEDGMEGRQGYSTQPADTMITLNVVPFGSSAWTQFAADTFRRLRFYKRAAPGQVFAVHFSRCEIKPPKRGAAGPVSSTQIMLRAHKDAANSGAANAQMWRSKILLGIG